MNNEFCYNQPTLDRFWAILIAFTAPSGICLCLFRLAGARLLLSDDQQRKTVHIIGDVAKTYFRTDPDHAFPSHQFAASAHGNHSKDMFDTAVYLRSGAFILLFSFGQLLEVAAIALQVFVGETFVLAVPIAKLQSDKQSRPKHPCSYCSDQEIH